MSDKEAKARIKINKLLEDAGWRFIDTPEGKANVQLEAGVKFETLGSDFEFAETQPWAETATPFEISTKKEIPNKKGGQTLAEKKKVIIGAFFEVGIICTEEKINHHKCNDRNQDKDDTHQKYKPVAAKK